MTKEKQERFIKLIEIELNLLIPLVQRKKPSLNKTPLKQLLYFIRNIRHCFQKMENSLLSFKPYSPFLII
jgi:hypothetical protein